MKQITVVLVSYLLLHSAYLHSQTVKFDKNKLQPVNVSMSVEQLKGRQVVRVIKDSTVKAADQPTFVRMNGIDFKNGSIEVSVLSRLLPNAPDYARGFIGVAFRINDSNSKFECIYIRPVNGRANNQIQRNHSIQYFSYPGYDFERFRKETPGQYESYADMGLNEWIKLKISVKDNQAKLFMNDNQQPSLIVNDLKHGTDLSGTIGLWVDVGTEGFFSNVKVYRDH